MTCTNGSRKLRETLLRKLSRRTEKTDENFRKISDKSANLHERVKHNCLFDSVTTKQIAALIFSSVMVNLFMDPKFKFTFSLSLLITRKRKIEKKKKKENQFHECLKKEYSKQNRGETERKREKDSKRKGFQKERRHGNREQFQRWRRETMTLARFVIGQSVLISLDRGEGRNGWDPGDPD